MNDVFRHIVSTTVAIFIVLSAVLVCAPLANAARASEGHCRPVQTKPAGGHCPQKDAMDCCATSAPQPASAPQDTQQQNTPTTTWAASAQADAIAVTSGLDVPGLAQVLRAAPLHGYRTTDLPILNAVFLI